MLYGLGNLYCSVIYSKETSFNISFLFSENLFIGRLICQIAGLFYMFLFYSGTSLHGGIKKDNEAVMVPNFFLTYLLCNKVT